MRMTVPLPNWRSIWVRAPCRAASLAFAGSWMLMPSTLGRGSDGRQHAFVTKACRFCAKSVDEGRFNGEHTVGPAVKSRPSRLTCWAALRDLTAGGRCALGRSGFGARTLPNGVQPGPDDSRPGAAG